MRVAIPHSLDKSVIRNRLRDHAHEIADSIPGGMAEVTTHWEHEDRMAMAIAVMGQSLSGAVDIEDHQVVFDVELPAALALVKPMVESTLRQQGERLVEPPKA